MSNPYFSILPLGGVGEIGSNLTVVRTPEQTIIIDAGILFPYEDHFDIDYLVVDVKILEKENVTDILFTHAHEDHIGAVAHILKKFPEIKIWASQFATSLIRHRLDEQGIVTRINIFRENDVLSFKHLNIHPVHVTHSIPETFGFLIEDKKKNACALYISDFKFDLNPPYEKAFNFEKIAKHFAAAKQTYAFLDSTNILYQTKTPSESELIPDIEEVVKSHPGRLFVTLFSSNIHRMQSFINACKKYKKPFSFLGRSIENYMTNARETGVLQYHEDDLRHIDELKDKSNILIFVSGCQGDHFSALKKLSTGEHPDFKLKTCDTVVFSSKVIPGNEKKIARIYNSIIAQGAEVITSKDKNIHASGHACQTDLIELINRIKPQHYIPIHGETLFLKRHAQFIQKKFPEIKTFELKNFGEIKIAENKTDIVQHEVNEPLIIHGEHLEIERSQISERRKMSCNGAVFVTFQKKNHELQITMYGLPLATNEKKIPLTDLISSKYNGMWKKSTDLELADNIKIEIRRYLNADLGYKPVTHVHVI
ncbi:MAG: ribonuclease J [Bacteriovoracaceae bacterium]|nr:ribonuclease J [Bacteriovoracaceae bacterium]